jgi:transcriptional regulator with XRE-family HTH domain
MSIRFRIMELRRRRGLTQVQLAALTGIPQRTLSRLEHQQSGGVTLERLEAIADALGVNASRLIDHKPRRR